MKKFLATTAAILVLLLACFAGYIKYQKVQSFKTLIPKSATALVRVNVYALLQSMAIDYLRTSGSDEEKDGGKGKSRRSGIELPANVFVYTVDGKAATTVFTSLNIKNSKDFEYTLNDQVKGLHTDRSNAAFILAKSADGKLSIAYNERLAAIAYSQQGEEVMPILTDLILKRNVVSVKESRFKKITGQDGHLVYMDGQNNASLRFSSGVISADVYVTMNGLEVPREPQHRKFNPESSAVIWLDANLNKELAGKIFSVDQYTLHADSLLKYASGAAQLEMQGTVQQQDSVVTYSYNDDFEKEAKTEIRQTAVPGIWVSLNTAEGLVNYLQRQQLLNADGSVAKAAFPLWQLQVLKGNQSVQVSTSKTALPVGAPEKTPYFFGLDINFNQLEKEQQFPAAARYIHSLKSLRAKAEKSGTRVHIEAGLFFNNKDRNPLIEWLGRH